MTTPTPQEKLDAIARAEILIMEGGKRVRFADGSERENVSLTELAELKCQAQAELNGQTNNAPTFVPVSTCGYR